jgi:hypothetical protein
MPHCPIGSWPWSLVLVCLLSAAGCNGLVRVLLESDEWEELPVKNEAGLQELAEQFRQAVEGGDHAAAYALTSSHVKARQTEEQFAAELKGQWERHTKGTPPLKAEVELYMPHQEELEDWDGIPSDLDYTTLQGQITLLFAREVQGEEILDGFDIDLFVVEEAGQPRIAYLEFYDYSE